MRLMKFREKKFLMFWRILLWIERKVSRIPWDNSSVFPSFWNDCINWFIWKNGCQDLFFVGQLYTFRNMSWKFSVHLDCSSTLLLHILNNHFWWDSQKIFREMLIFSIFLHILWYCFYRISFRLFESLLRKDSTEISSYDSHKNINILILIFLEVMDIGDLML